jgi:type I restriction enzyme, S subunit
MLPDGWSSYYLRDLFALTSGKPRPKKDLSSQATTSKQYPVFGGNGITGYTDEFLLKKQTIVIGRVGEYCGCVHLAQDACWVTDNALYIRSVQSELDLVFLSYLLKFLRLDRLRSKTGQPLVSQEPIYSLFVKLPPSPNSRKSLKFSVA